MQTEKPQETVYQYSDETGTVLYEVVRRPDKQFRQRTPDGKYSLNGVRRVLYHLPALVDHITSNDPAPIYICEGEKDVHAVELAGGTATCNPMGAGKWQPEYSESLMGARTVLIVADKDEPGYKHAEAVRLSLADVGIVAAVVQARTGKDAADHLAAGHPLDALEPYRPKPSHSWASRSLIDLDAKPPEPPTIGGILYPGKRTLISGETEALKTWLALILAKAELDAGLPVAWVDLDDMGSAALLFRLRALGVSDAAIHDRFLYYQPEERLADDRLRDALLELSFGAVRLMVIDAFTPMLALHGKDPNNSIEIEQFWREICDPLTKIGVAPCLLDHVVKNADSRGKYATGSERKASGATVHIGAQLLEPLSIGGTGRSVLHVHKDRPGYLPRPTLGRLVLESDGANIAYKLEEDRSHAGDAFRPTVLMERVSLKIEQADEPMSRNEIETAVTGNRKAVRTAIETLVEEGYLTRTPGPRNSHLHTSFKPYREVDDSGCADAPDDLALTSPSLRPNLAGFGTSSSPSPLWEGRGGRASEGTWAKSNENGAHDELDPGYLAYLETIAGVGDEEHE